MPNIVTLALGLLFAAWLLPEQAQAELKLSLEAKAGDASARAVPPAVDLEPRARPVLHAKLGSTVVVNWAVTNEDKAQTQKKVLVHFFAVRQDKPGQRAVPRLDRGVVAENAVTTDFGPGERTGAKVRVVIDERGAYLLRLEALPSGTEAQQQAVAFDLIVE